MDVSLTRKSTLNFERSLFRLWIQSSSSWSRSALSECSCLSLLLYTAGFRNDHAINMLKTFVGYVLQHSLLGVTWPEFARISLFGQFYKSFVLISIIFGKICLFVWLGQSRVLKKINSACVYQTAPWHLPWAWHSCSLDLKHLLPHRSVTLHFWSSCSTTFPVKSLSAVASPGFVARRGKDGNYVMGHSRWTSGPGAAAARWLIVLWLMQKELWVLDICVR